MSGELAKGFLNDIVANIDDNTPRLVYADWLEENGQDDRAEFIRVQVDLARLPAWDAAQVRLRLREQALLKQHGEKWLSELPAIEGATWEGFRRGIVAEVSFASFEAMRANAHACRAVAPVEAIKVRWPRKREAKKSAPLIAELRELTVTGYPYGEDVVAYLAGSPQLSTLRILTARGLWADGMTLLVASPHLARLKALRLPSNNLGNEGVIAMIQGAALASLEELDLSGRGVAERYADDPVVRSPGMESLAGWKGLATVRSLNLARNEFGRAGLQTLLRSPNAAGLTELTLRSCGLNGQAMAEFADAVAGLRLESLDVGENVLKEVGAEYLATAVCLSELKSLRIDRCELPLAAARVLAKKARFLSSLRLLEVGDNGFGPAGLDALLKQEPASLHTLRLRDNDIFDKGVALLAASPVSDGLLDIDLSLNRLTSAATLALSETEHLAELQVLRLGENQLSEAAKKTVTNSPLGKRLSVLDFEDAPPAVDPDYVDYDEDAFPEGGDEIAF